MSLSNSEITEILSNARPYHRPEKGFIRHFVKIRKEGRIPVIISNNPAKGCSIYRFWENQYGGGTTPYYFLGRFQSPKIGSHSVTEKEYFAIISKKIKNA